MNLYKLLNYPNHSKSFLNLNFDYNQYTVLVSGSIEITQEYFAVPYDGNLVAGGYTETETTDFKININNIQIFNEYGNKILSPKLEKVIMNQIEIDTRL